MSRRSLNFVTSQLTILIATERWQTTCGDEYFAPMGMLLAQPQRRIEYAFQSAVRDAAPVTGTHLRTPLFPCVKPMTVPERITLRCCSLADSSEEGGGFA
jgi:hypothetical protein